MVEPSVWVARADVSKKPKVAQTYRVSEIYGPVCQGEGLLLGLPTIFVRLGGCDYRCSWCDSKYAVDPKYRGEWKEMSAPKIAAEVDEIWAAEDDEFQPRPHVTLSGGNPAIWPLTDLLEAFRGRRFTVAIETQGSTVPRSWIHLIHDVTLSPKPPSSGNETPFTRDTALHSWVLNAQSFARSLCLKVVIFDDADYAYAKRVHQQYPDVPFVAQAGTDVGVASRDDLCVALLNLQERVINDPDMRAVRVLPQMHAILKGHQRGI